MCAQSERIRVTRINSGGTAGVIGSCPRMTWDEGFFICPAVFQIDQRKGETAMLLNGAGRRWRSGGVRSIWRYLLFHLMINKGAVSHENQ